MADGEASVVARTGAAGAAEPPDPRFAQPRTLFFGIGAQKSGTSWIDRYLRVHPEVCLPARKEQHYWDSHRVPGTKRPAKVERKLKKLAAMGFAERLLRTPARRSRDHSYRLAEIMLRDMSNGHRAYADAMFQIYRGQPVAGEITPAYALLAARDFAEMAALGPDVRFFFVMRDPYARLISGVRHQLRKRHGRSAVTEERVIAGVEATLADPEDSRMLRSRYDRTIGELEAAVPAERIAYFFFERLFQQSELDRLTALLGVGSRPGRFERKVNVGAGGDVAIPEVLEARAMAALAPVYAFARERFGDAVPAKWRRDAGTP